MSCWSDAAEVAHAEARFEAATEACVEAENLTEKVPTPDALIATEDDFRVHRVEVGAPFNHDAIQYLRRLCDLAPRRDSPDLGFFGDAFRARVDELTAALNQWNEARRLARERRNCRGGTARPALQREVRRLRSDREQARAHRERHIGEVSICRARLRSSGRIRRRDVRGDSCQHRGGLQARRRGGTTCVRHAGTR
jgi:hypothetical protein